MDYDDGLEEAFDARQERRYLNALMAHPDPRDPDYPTREEFGLEDDDE